MVLHGANLIAGEQSRKTETAFSAVNPRTSEALLPSFPEASLEEIDRAFLAAESAFDEYRNLPPERIAAFLQAIAEELATNESQLISRAEQETALPPQRLQAEILRTCNHLHMFADVVLEGSWVGAYLDSADPERSPNPKPDMRRRSIALGPVVVFGASNFPFAYSTIGGDSASALAAGCPVIVKAHPAHPGTSELTAEAVYRAAKSAKIPLGVFSLLHGSGHEVGAALVAHSKAKAVGFTGSLRGGRALFDIAAKRACPIPVYAEMGSVNPVFVLPQAMEQSGESIAQGFCNAVIQGVGQFCTCPGLLFAVEGKELDLFSEKLIELFSQIAPESMLHAGIRNSYEQGISQLSKISQVSLLCYQTDLVDTKKTQAAAALLSVPGAVFLENPTLAEEVFGPSTILVRCQHEGDFEQIANELQGQLTARIFGGQEELRSAKKLFSILETKVGRLIINSFLPSLELCYALQHGGPYPASTDSRSSSQGQAAIQRFVRPLCYQNAPEYLLPLELHDENPHSIWRMRDGVMGKE